VFEIDVKSILPSTAEMGSTRKKIKFSQFFVQPRVSFVAFNNVSITQNKTVFKCVSWVRQRLLLLWAVVKNLGGCQWPVDGDLSVQLTTCVFTFYALSKLSCCLSKIKCAHAPYHVTYRYRVKNNYIFGIRDPNLAICMCKSRSTMTHTGTVGYHRLRCRSRHLWNLLSH